MFSAVFSRVQDKLTYSEEKIGQFLIKHYLEEQNFEVLGSEQVAELIECGQSTVIRFSQKLGYSTYKLMISELINEAMYSDQSMIENSEPIRESMLKLQKQYNQSLVTAISQNSDETIEKCVSYLEKANSILCFGLRGSFAIVSLLYYRLRESGFGAICEESLYDAISILGRMSESDVLVVISVSGETPETVAVVKAAKKRNIHVVSITGNHANTIAELSDVALACSDVDIHTRRFNLINRCSLLYLVDIIFLLLWHKNEKKMIEKANDYYEEISEFRNNLGGKIQLRF